MAGNLQAIGGVEDLFATPYGEVLPSDNMLDDRTDSALQAREQSYRQADALQELLDSADVPEPEAQPEAAPEEEESLPGMAGAIAMDVGRGAIEMPKQIFGGMRDAVESFIQLGDILEETLPIGGPALFDQQGNFDPQILSADELAKRGNEPMLPEVGGPESVTGAGIRGVTQFLAPFKKVSQAIGGLRGATKLGTAGRALGAGALTDFAAFSGDQNLSSLIQSNPMIANSVNEFLAAKPDDPEALGRLKNAVEGAGLGVLGAGLIKGLTALRAVRGVMASGGEKGFQRAAAALRLTAEERMLREAGEMRLLGNANEAAPLILKTPKITGAVRTKGEPLPESGVAVAMLGSDGTIYVGKKGGLHFQISEKFPHSERGDWAGTGFVTPDGRFLNRKEALAWVNENEGKVKPSSNVPGMLDAMDYREQVKLKKATKQTQTGVPDDVAARALTAKGLSPLDGTSDVFVNFARINTPDDIKQIIKDASSAFKPDVDAARRGIRTNAQTLLSAEDVNAWDVLMTRRTGQPLNAEQSIAARQLWATAGDKLGQVANMASVSPTPENLFQFRRMLATFHAIQKEVIGARSETARALQSWSIPVGGNLEKMRDMTAALDQAGGLQESADLARRFAAAARLNYSPIDVMSKMAEKTFYRKALGGVQEYWINALLSGPKTHMVNIMSNVSVAALSVIERGAAARLGRMFSDEAGVELGESMAMLDGIRGGILDAFRNAGKAFITGETGYGVGKIEMPRERYISSGTWNVRSDSWLGRGVDALGTAINVPGKMLQAEDEFFKTIGYRQELHAQATRMVSREIREGKLQPGDAAARRAQILDNPPESIRMEAVASAAYQTFTNEAGRLTKGVQRIIGQYPPLKFILPFVNTPSNILKYTFERTPLAPLSSKYRAAIAEGGANADLARTKMALGTMSLLFAIDLGLHGHTTGSGPNENMAELQNWRRQGNQPYSVKFGNKQIAFNRLDPLAYMLGMGADIAEFIINSESDDDLSDQVEEGIAATVFSVAENVTSKAYLQGLSNILEAMNEPKRFASAYVERFASSFVPTGVAEIARLIDPSQRQAHDIVSSMKRRLPGFSSDLPPRLDIWGREIRYESGLGKGYDTLSPLYGSTYKPEPIDKLMQQDGWYLGAGQNYFMVEGERVSLKNRPEIRSRFIALRGGTKPSAIEAEGLLDKYGDSTLLETLNAVVTGESDLSPAFQELETPEDREDFVQRIVRDYYNAAKKRLFEEYPELTESALRKKAARPQQ